MEEGKNGEAKTCNLGPVLAGLKSEIRWAGINSSSYAQRTQTQVGRGRACERGGGRQGSGSGFKQVSGSGSVFGIQIRIQEGKNDPQSDKSRKKMKKFYVLK
jgi:hypothetical protein